MFWSGIDYSDIMIGSSLREKTRFSLFCPQNLQIWIFECFKMKFFLFLFIFSHFFLQKCPITLTMPPVWKRKNYWLHWPVTMIPTITKPSNVVLAPKINQQWFHLHSMLVSSVVYVTYRCHWTLYRLFFRLQPINQYFFTFFFHLGLQAMKIKHTCSGCGCMQVFQNVVNAAIGTNFIMLSHSLIQRSLLCPTFISLFFKNDKSCSFVEIHIKRKVLNEK